MNPNGPKKNRLTFGVGINDVDYPTKPKNAPPCPYFLVWRGMIQRVYDPNHLKKRPSYLGSSVCAEWLSFSNFRDWIMKQDWKGKQLDKDLLVPGNKVYGPDLCCFVSQQVNSFLTDIKAKRSNLPVGVKFHKPTGTYGAYIKVYGVGRKSLGYHPDPETAHQAWLEAKRELASAIAKQESNPAIAAALLSRYSVQSYGKKVAP